MAIFGTSFQIGRSALAAYQAALTVSGQNIANVGNADYTRQSARLAALAAGQPQGTLQPGAGVQVNALQRHIDDALEARLRDALGQRDGAATTYNYLTRIESLYDELSETDLSSQLSTFFSGFATLQTDPAEETSRELVLNNANAVVGTLQRQRSGLLDLVTDLNRQAAAQTERANQITDEIAALNAQVVTAEGGTGGGASALRDRRDALLRELGQMVDIQTREYDNGIVNVYVGSEPVVDFDRSRGLKTVTVNEEGLERVEVRFADNDGEVVLSDGTLGALLATRDTHVQGQLDQLDELARALIYEVNRVHSTGRGLVGYTDTTSTYAVRDPDAALNSSAAGLSFPVRNGTLIVQVRDQDTGQLTTRQIKIDLDGLGAGDTTLNSFVGALDAVNGLSASATADGRLRLETDDGFEVSFSDDTSGVLAALGVGTFFEGIDATTMAVRPEIQAEPDLIATSLNGAPGDGSNAGRLAAAGEAASALLDSKSILQYQQSMVARFGAETAAAEVTHTASDAVYSSLLAQRESISGVSLDEEAINLTTYQRAFEGAARFLTVIQSLSAEVMTLVG